MRMLRVVVVCTVWLSACSYPPLPRAIGDEVLDASPEVDTPLPVDAQVCFGTTTLVRVCLESPPTKPLTISGPTQIDTADLRVCARTTSGAENYCVLAGTDISITAPWRGVGPKPLVLIASGTITSTAAGVIDVGSHRARPIGAIEAGAGANFAGCDVGTAPAVSGGGAGGSFLGKGGNGATASVAGTTGGTSGARVNTVTELRGGCPGQDGAGGAPGLKGLGGGAVFLIAGTSITIAGAINAAGEGGGGGVTNLSGGGGGGSGGMIGFDAPTIAVTSLLLASGGGGGEGSRETANGAGGDGSDPTTTAPAAGGTSNDPVSGNGGKGSQAEIAGSGNNGGPGQLGNGGTRGAGGGGGGGAGIIIAPATATFTQAISPPATR
jgi:hypothetical protein